MLSIVRVVLTTQALASSRFCRRPTRLLTPLSAKPPLTDDPVLATLRDRFGLADFRPGQREIVDSIHRGEDALVVSIKAVFIRL